MNGEKTFITSGIRADYLTVAVRTDPRAEGARGISLLLIEGDEAPTQDSVERLMGMLLVAISVQMLLDGVAAYLRAAPAL